MSKIIQNIERGNCYALVWWENKTEEGCIDTFWNAKEITIPRMAGVEITETKWIMHV